MDIQKVYDSLISLDPEEQIAYQYYQKYGEELDYFDAVRARRLNPDLEKEPDFSGILSEESKRKKELLVSYMFGKQSNQMLAEQFFIASKFNVELNYAQRYIRMFPHQHDFYEVVCTLRGHCQHSIESQEIEMKTGDIVILPPNIFHNVYAYPESVALNIKIRKSTFDRVFISILQNKTPLSDYFAQTLYSCNYRNSLTFHCGDDPFLFELLLYMYAQQEEAKPYATYVIDGLLTTFFSYLVQNYENAMEFSSARTNGGTNERMVQIENYIHQNYQTATLKQVADHFYLSQPYLSTLIKKQTGHSFSTILREVRMKQAADMLRNSGMKVDDICEVVGYRDTTQFIRSFKAYYGVTPKQYQKAGGAAGKREPGKR